MAENTLRPARDAVQQANAGMDRGAWFVSMTDRAHFEATGRHRARFVHNFTTCQVKELPEGQGRWAAVTSGQGGVLALALIRNLGESLHIEVARELRDEIIAHLTKYRIADQVVFTPRDDLATVAVVGEDAVGLLEGLGVQWPDALDSDLEVKGVSALNAVTIGDVAVTVLRDDFRWGTPSVSIVAKSADMETLVGALKQAGALEASSERRAAHRLARGIPRERLDVDTDTTPLESQHLRGVVDWNKGCYLGQEVICMMEDLGKPRKMVVELAFDGAPPSHGAAVLNDKGKSVGWVGTTGTIDGSAYGLATVKRKHAKAGAALKVDGGLEATVVGIAGVVA